MAEKRTVTLHIRIDEPLADALKAMADADERKISPYVARVLRRHVETEGPAVGVTLKAAVTGRARK
jgi:hypothetical protein